MRFRWLPVLLSCAACGGHSAAAIGERPADSAGAGGVDESEAPAAGETESGGAGSPLQGAAGELGDAGAPGYVPHIGSGTRNCESSEYCFGLACYAPPSFAPTVCVANCEADLDCGPNEVCVRSAKLAPTCYARCRVPGDCEYHFDCLDFSGEGQLVCFPAGWAGRRGELD